MASNIVPYRGNVASDATAITLTDSTDIANYPCGGFIVGTAGNLKVMTAEGTTLTLTGLQAGQIVPLRIRQFWSTGSTAGSIVALF